MSNIFNDFFSQESQPTPNHSILPSMPAYYWINRLNDISFNYDKILNINLDPNKAHGHDGVSVKMLKFSSLKTTAHHVYHITTSHHILQLLKYEKFSRSLEKG